MSGHCLQVFLYLFFANNLFITSTLIVGASDVVNTLVSAASHGLGATCCRQPPARCVCTCMAWHLIITVA